MAQTCKYHPQSAAEFTCFDCQKPLCEECIRTRDDGTIACATCASGNIDLADMPGVAVENTPATPCVNHPGMPAVARCSQCQAMICTTCGFAFDELLLCPRCAVPDVQTLTPQRKKMGLWGLGLGVVNVPISVLSFVAIQFLPELGREAQMAANVISSIVLLVCLGISIMGFLLGIYAFERKSANPAYLWIGPVLNGLIGAFWVLILVAGLFALSQG